ncbi:protein unc-45 homolog B-like [Temnothorax longispinosus]|uniref:protein unc-45 homolog B-like n=1 Tax=Temnothorax longispinosus TaxID=300112 RepID=UPI003A9943D2
MARVINPQEWKEKGNEEFNKGNWSDAASHYTNALKLGIENNAEKGVCYKNRAVAYLMLDNYEEVIKDCQALEGLKRFDEAYRDAEIIVSSDPNNEVIQSVKERLHEIAQGRREDPNLIATIMTKTVVQQGGTKALLSLALDDTDNKGKKIASQVLVHLALTLPPEVAFPADDLMMDVVQPITNLLNRGSNLICEALTALCNLAAVNNSMRVHIFNDSGLKNFSNYISQNVISIIYKKKIYYNRKRYAYACAELINNLVLCREVAIQYVEQRSYQFKDLMTWSVAHSEDERTKKAAAETLAILTAASKETCEKLLSWDFWRTFLHLLLNNPDNDLQLRGIKIVLNMMKSTKDVAAKLIETDIIMKRVRELSDNNSVQNKEIKDLASLVLEAAAKWDRKSRK